MRWGKRSRVKFVSTSDPSSLERRLSMSERNDGFQVVADLSQLPDPGKITLEVNGRVVVLVRTDGDVYCIDDVCTHDGGTLGDGELEDHCLVCPRHGASLTSEPATRSRCPLRNRRKPLMSWSKGTKFWSAYRPSRLFRGRWRTSRGSKVDGGY